MVVASSTALYVGISETALVELLAFRDALRWCLAYGWHSMMLLRKIRDGEVANVHRGTLLEEIRYETCSRSFGLFLWVGILTGLPIWW
ncbi:unnamed protein product [Linum trigynum]